MKGDDFRSSNLAIAFKKKYSGIPENQDERLLESIIKIVSTSCNPRQKIDASLTEVAVLIHRMMNFKQVAIALRDRKDGLFRYRIFLGYRQESVSAFKKITYSITDIADKRKFPRIEINRNVHFFLAEFKPYLPGEEETFSFPTQMDTARKSLDESIEGDYFEFYLFGDLDELCGFIELSRPSNGKLPSRQMIKWIELTAMVLGKSICSRNL